MADGQNIVWSSNSSCVTSHGLERHKNLLRVKDNLRQLHLVSVRESSLRQFRFPISGLVRRFNRGQFAWGFALGRFPWGCKLRVRQIKVRHDGVIFTFLL